MSGAAADYGPIEALLPHAGPAILLDALVEADAERVLCTRTVPHGGPLHDADGHLPAWAGIELMAQAVAAWAGWQARREGRPVRLGFLLGTRHYRCDVDAFPAGTVLAVEAVRGFHDDAGMGVFHCRIDAPGLHAEARLTVFSPPDGTAFLAGHSLQGNTA
ncbi:3-hydroxylacyl-ACP dehydratase [Frateuria defendens]|uniref:ApeP family dehydratase n=1 Tax=Frateuria defendens TaxID=2219559 RepID=UPI00066FBCF5|nr:3-hydroxylacyl-ACP dehydratase [Frateuria defendens]